MDHIYECGQSWRDSPDLWSVQWKRFLRSQHRTESGRTKYIESEKHALQTQFMKAIILVVAAR